MQKINLNGVITEVKSTKTTKEDAEIEEQTIKVATDNFETVVFKGRSGFMDDFILDENGEIMTKIDIEIEIKRVQKTIAEAIKNQGD